MNKHLLGGAKWEVNKKIGKDGYVITLSKI